MLAGIALYTLASLACAGADGLGALIAMRAVQGIGGALMMALAMALVGESVPRDRVGRAMGLLGTVSATGTALGPTLGGVMIEQFGWPAIFLVNVPLGVAAFAFAWRGLPQTRVATEARFDPISALLLTLALAGYALGSTRKHGQLGAGWVVLASLAGIAFVRREAASRSPLIQPGLFRARDIRNGFVGSALVTTVAMTTLVVGPFYLGDALHLGASATGLVMSAGPLIAAVVGVPAGRGVDRWGTARMTIIGLLAMAAGATALAWISVSTGVFGYVLPLMLLTAGFATFQAANNAAVLGAAEPGQRGLVSGLLHLSRNLGLLTGASAMGAIFAAGSDVVAGTHAAFAAAFALIAATLAIALLARRGNGTKFRT
jgi:MFS family permease